MSLPTPHRYLNSKSGKKKHILCRIFPWQKKRENEKKTLGQLTKEQYY